VERANCFARALELKAAAIREFAVVKRRQGECREAGIKNKLLCFLFDFAKQKFLLLSEAK